MVILRRVVAKFRWSPSGDYVAVFCAFLALGFLLQHGGRVPLGDSWSYSWTAARFVEHGTIELTPFQGMTLVGQILLAAPVGAVFSTAPSVFNRLTLVLSAATLVMFLRIYRSVGIGRSASLVAIGTLAANPLWLSQSMSFETEIPFLFFAGLGTWALTRWDRGHTMLAGWAAGLAFAGAAAVRQHALALSLGGFLYSATKGGGVLRWMPWLLPPATIVAVYGWLAMGQGLPVGYAQNQEMMLIRWRDPALLVSSTCRSLVGALHYLGLFLLPVSVLVLRKPGRTLGAFLTSVACLLLATATVALWVGFGEHMPYFPHILQSASVLGPFGLAEHTRGFEAVWTIAGLLSGCLLLVAIANILEVPSNSGSSDLSPAAIRYLPISGLLLLGFTITTGLGFDRYLLPVIPFLLPALVLSPILSRRRMAMASFLVALLLVGSSVIVDQRVRLSSCEWDAAEALRAEGVEPHRINGGIAFNGYYSYQTLSRSLASNALIAPVPWIQPDAEFLVSRIARDQLGLTLQGIRICGNWFGLAPWRAWIYRCQPRDSNSRNTPCQPF